MTGTTQFADLSALFLNCSIKRDKTQSHTQRLLNRAAGIMEEEGVAVEQVYLLDHQIAFGMEKDLTQSGWDRDDWPMVQDKILAADILVIGSPIWLGQKSSVATLVSSACTRIAVIATQRGSTSTTARRAAV